MNEPEPEPEPTTTRKPSTGEHRDRAPRPRSRPRVDYLRPEGAPALYAPDSIAWHVFKNPVSLFVGGIAAVLLELGEPRVRSGVWGHSMFPYDPITRLRRTGHVTHVCAYAPREVAQRVIAGVVRMHERVRGHTPEGTPYHANDPELLDWVQATVDYGFLEAYAAHCRALTDHDRDRFYRESVPTAELFGATGAPRSLAEQREQFEAMRPRLEPHPIVLEFLDIMTRTPAVPRPLEGLQGMMVRAGVDLLPDWAIERLELRRYALRGWERRVLWATGHLLERVPLPGSPPVLASRRMGLPGSYLYWGRSWS
ncbi:oxygenase MpaB family protein [Paraliomyxa miuraensis]|uniref:oxygenase MpaB family protein n=1 Tax=Paraliomyxa miuraensis TaxID=376150 RepID=UPI0022520F3F|nr:oxygenase MpaB family protein [Paraliomyxa miuraensis]MCX4245186.1 oxygenase MpaB family protein [Paraliomyxa miuraensis]